MYRTITLIAAMDKNRGIGKNNALPWSMSSELRHFRLMTLHRTVVMGRKTFESIGKPLPDRRNIIISKNPSFKVEGALVVSSIEELFEVTQPDERLFVIGGEAIYKEMLAHAKYLVLSLIDADIEADAHFPEYDDGSFKFIYRLNADRDPRDQYNYSVVYYVRS